MNTKDSASLYARASAYRLLSLFLNLPNDLVAQGVKDGSAASDLDEILRDCGFEDENICVLFKTFSSETDCDDLLSRLRRDYTRLFTNPENPLVPIYEAVFKESTDFDTSQLTFISATAIDAEFSYKKFDLAIDLKKHDSPDHMAAEIEFLCFLYLKLSEAVSNNEISLAEECEIALDEFYAKHISKWAADFFEAVELRALTPQYRAIGALGCLMIEREAKERQAL